MKKILIAAAAVSFGFITLSSTAYAVDVNEGKWEITSTMTGMAGMPPMTNKMTQCITKDSLVPTMKDDKSCSIYDMKTSGNKVSWKIKCTGDAAMTGGGEITYNKTSYDGFMNMTMAMTGQPSMTMNYKMTGKRIGACDKK